MLTVQNFKQLSSFLKMFFMKTGEQSSPWKMSSICEPWIPLVNRQLFPSQTGQLLKQGQYSVRLFLDGHLQSLVSESGNNEGKKIL